MGNKIYDNKRSMIIRSIQRDSCSLFFALTILSLLVLFAVVLLTNGSYLSEFFFLDIRDTGMDFFNSLAETSGGDPYGRFGTLYPPLANLFFYVLQRCVPNEIADLWAPTHSQVVGMRGTNLDLRTYQAPMLMFLLFLLGTMLLLNIVVEHMLKDYSVYAKAASVASCFCYGTLWAVERGNILLLAMLFSLVFVSYYNDERPVMRELALIALAIAAGLKLYPALFGLLLLQEKQWKRALRCVMYGLAAFFLPFFVFNGLSDLRLFLEIFFSFNDQGSAALMGYGLSSIVTTFYELVYRKIGIALPFRQYFALFLMLLVTVILLCALAKASSPWKRLLCLVLLLVFLQPSGGYTLSFILLPFLAFLRDHPSMEKKHVPFYVCFLILLLPYPCPMLLRYAVVVSALASLTLMVFFLFGRGAYMEAHQETVSS